MKKIFFTSLSIISFLFSCGLPDSSSFQDLQIPAIIVDGTHPICEKNNEGGINITFKLQGYNPEAMFSGYNIYIVKEAPGISEVKNKLIAESTRHIQRSSGLPIFYTAVEDNFIILKMTNEQPSIKTSDLTPGYNQQHTISTFTATSLPKGENNGGSILPGTIYGFGLTAVSVPGVKESKLGNVILLETTRLSDPTGPCRIIVQETFSF